MNSVLSRVSSILFYPWMNAGFRRWSYLLLALAIVVITGTLSLSTETGRAGIDLSMNGSRVVYGLTLAISHYRFGSPLYSYYTPVLDIFWTNQTATWAAVNDLIAKAVAMSPNAFSPQQLHIGFGELDYDDKGVILWYSAAFALFGPHLGSIYLVYFGLLVISLVVFWLSFQEDEAALMLLPLYALVHGALAGFVLAGNPAIMGTLLTTRPFAMLAALPTLHLALLMLRKRSPTPWRIAGAAAQIAFLLLIISVRSSAQTQLLLLFLIAAFMLARWVFRKVESVRDLHRSFFGLGFAWVSACLVTGMACASIAYAVEVPAQVRERALTGHLMWHNMLAGFILDKELTDDLFHYAKAYKSYDKVPGHDELAFISVVGFYKVQYHQDIAESVLGAPDKRNINVYEAGARTLFFSELRRRPLEIARLLVVTKTDNIYETMKQVSPPVRSKHMLAAAFILGLLGGSAWLRGLLITAPLIVVGFMISSVSAYLFAPAPHIMYDYVPYFYLGFLCLPATLGALLSHCFMRYVIRHPYDENSHAMRQEAV